MSVSTTETIATPTEPVEEPFLTERQKWIVGGLGGVTPIILTVATGDGSNLSSADSGYEIFYVLGVIIRAAFFFLVGAFFVWLHQSVRSREAVFRLGIAAPAIIIAMAQATPGGAAEADIAMNSAASEVVVASLGNASIDSVMSDALPPNVYFGKCTILDGLLGRKCKKDP